MPIVSIETLKGYFNDGDVPTELEYIDLIDTLNQGDMSKSVYDTNDDGKVNSAHSADAAPWSGITGKPATYPATTPVADSNALGGVAASSYLQRTSAARPGVTRLYRDDADSGYYVRHYWTGSHWYLQGYNSSGVFHAGCRVEYANVAPWTGISGKPSTFTPSAHTHSGGDITSQVSDANTVDSLHAASFVRSDADDTKTGDLRSSGGLVIGSTSDLAANGEIRATGDVYPNLIEYGVRFALDNWVGSPYEHFDVGSRPTGWSKTGSHTDSYGTYSNVQLTGATGTTYLYRTLVSSTTYRMLGCLSTVYGNSNFGVRIQGSDSNYYAEYVCYSISNGIGTKLQYRSGSGDTNHEVSGAQIQGNPFPLMMELLIQNTRWSNWQIVGRLGSIGSPAMVWAPNTSNQGLNWTPVTMGIKFYASGGTWETAWCDFFDY